MRWILEVTLIAVASSWKWLLGSLVGIGALIGLLFGVGVLGGGGDGDTNLPPVAVASTPTPAPSPTQALEPPLPPAATPKPDPTAIPTAVPAKVISVPILATRASNVGSLEFVLVYDPVKLELAQVERGILSDDALIDSSPTGPGQVWTGIVDVQGMDGSGPVAVIKFTVKNDASGSMPILLEDVAAFDASTLVDIVTGSTAGQFNGADLPPLSPIVSFQ